VLVEPNVRVPRRMPTAIQLAIVASGALLCRQPTRRYTRCNWVATTFDIRLAEKSPFVLGHIDGVMADTRFLGDRSPVSTKDSIN